MKPSPDAIYGPKLASLFRSFCDMIVKESGASSVRVEAQFILKNGKGDLKMKTFTSPDAKTERMLDPDKPMHRGSKLQLEASAKIRTALTKFKNRRS